MQYAIIATGGKQYMASIGQSIVIEALPQTISETVVFDQVLLVVDGDAVTIGQPVVSGVTVSATIVEQRLGQKLRVFKYRPKSRYSRTNGHRQHETVVKIESIGDIQTSQASKTAAGTKNVTTKPKATRKAPINKAVKETPIK